MNDHFVEQAGIVKLSGQIAAARAAGFAAVVGFDMGGTSTDVSHWAGHFERRFETTVAGVRLRTPMLDIHTIAAGGGSICRFDGARLRVGPESAGAVPGPAAYRRGGPLTVTDASYFEFVALDDAGLTVRPGEVVDVGRVVGGAASGSSATHPATATAEAAMIAAATSGRFEVRFMARWTSPSTAPVPDTAKFARRVERIATVHIALAGSLISGVVLRTVR